MRVGVWWVAGALTLLAVSSALRTTQEEFAPRAGRRLSALTAPSAPLSEDKTEETQSAPTFRPRASRRNDEISPQEFSRIRPKNRPTAINAETSRTKPEENNKRSDSRRSYSRTRNRTTEPEPIKEPASRENVIRNKNRFSSRRSSQSTAAPIETSSPTIDESKIEVVSTTLDEIAKSTPKEYVAATQHTRRNPVSQTTESFTTRRGRTRINVRTNAKPLDLTVSGTTNAIMISNKDSTTARTSPELRSSKKLRYKPRSSETDTNLTGEGLATINEVTKSSQNKDTTSQSGVNSSPTVILITAQASTETNPSKTTTNRSTKVVRRPLAREKVNFKPSSSLTNRKKSSDEIGEDDNYPASFKALLQAKNGSTQASSPESESLSVKASQKVYSTFTSSVQSTETASENNKTSRFRDKASVAFKKDENKKDEQFLTPSQVDQETPKYVSRHRGSFNPKRNRKTFDFTSSTATSDTSVGPSTDRASYKYNRKFKVSTTELPSTGITFKQRKLESSNLVKKPAVRPSFFTRRQNSTVYARPLSNVDNASMENDASNVVIRKKILPKTSYYSRLRNKNKTESASSTTEPIIVSSVEIASTENVKEVPVDMPLVFNLLNKPPEEENKLETSTEIKEQEKQKEMFIIAIASKESQEAHSENVITSSDQEGDDKPFTNFMSSTSKYHSILKGENIEKESVPKGQSSHVSTPTIRNIQTRKFGRQRHKQKEDNAEETVPSSTTPRSRGRNLRKFSDNYSKATEPSTNGIQAESEKSKNRYSSKFRASNTDKPIYKATVPTVTPSTAWLKFFITDHQLEKAVEEPYWFRRDDLHLTTEQPRSFTKQPTNHESSIELVEGEEFQLGPDMNAISVTLPRSTLSSADLRLSESIMKPSHIINLEASQHSSSVTISIFDALAEILTSTPRIPRLSTTTEVTKNFLNTDTKKTFNGVSNSITVNKVKGLENQDTITSISNELNTYTKSVQATHQSTQSVNNRVLVVGSSTSSLNTEPMKETSVNTLSISTPTPTTPISARRPFAIKLLYSEPPTDQLSTATEPTTNPSSTDNSSTVYNTVSDLLLTNNNLLSSELTSMLSNNIKSILQNMDVETRSKLKIDMDKVLRSLIPRALDRLTTSNNDGESTLNTTPYSLEEIEDTENVDIVNGNNSDTKININLLQNVTDDESVNNMTVGRSAGLTETSVQAVNIANETQGILLNTLSVSSSQTTQAESVSKPTTDFVTTSSITPNPIMSSVSTDIDKEIVNNSDTRTAFSDSANNNVPLPFFTNANIQDINKADEIETVTSQVGLLPLTKSVTTPLGIDNINLQDPSQISPLQLWVLSKKARVLKMIEDLIRQNNDELATAVTLTDVIQENNIPLSNRLTQILNSMTTTTEAYVSPNVGSTSSTSTLSSSPLPLSTLSESSSTTNNENQKTVLTTQSNVVSDNVESTTAANIARNNSLRLSESTTMSYTDTETFRDLIDTTTLPPSSRTTTEKETSTTETASGGLDGNTVITTTPQDSTETTTAVTTTISVETETTQTILETTTSVNTDTKTQTNFDKNSTTTSTDERKQNTNLNIGQPTIPKKDYVIFGILPNNTVVRKDPNDDVLETLTEASPYIIYGVLPNNTVIRKFPNGTRVPRVMQKIDVLPISPWSLRNPYSPIHNNPAIVRPQFNPIRVSTNTVTFTDTFSNGPERLTNDTVNNQQIKMIPTSALNISDSSSLGVTIATNMSPAEKSTASHVLSLRTTTMLPSVDEILLNSISSAAKEDMVISSTTTSTREPTILTLDIDPETQQIRTEKPSDGNGTAVFKFIPINEVTVSPLDSNVLKLASTKAPSTSNANAEVKTETATVTEINTQTPPIETTQTINDLTTTVQIVAATPSGTTTEIAFTNPPPSTSESRFSTFTAPPSTTIVATTLPPTTTTRQTTTEATTSFTTTQAPTTVPILTTTAQSTTVTSLPTTEEKQYEEDAKILQNILQTTERSAKSLNIFSSSNQISSEATTGSVTSTARVGTIQFSNNEKLVQAILAPQSSSTLSIPNIGGNLRISQAQSTTQSTTSRSLEDDLKQFEEDTKLLKALLAATGQNPANFNIPSLDSLNLPNRQSSTIPPTTTLRQTTTQKTTTPRVTTTTLSIEDDIKQFSEDAKLLQTLLKANVDAKNVPIITANSNVRIASNPLTTSIGSNPTTPLDIRPVYTSRTTTSSPRLLTTTAIGITPVLTTLQPASTSTSSTSSEGPRKYPITTARIEQSTPTARRAPVSRFTVTTEIPSTSTFSDEEDIQFLKNLKSVLSTNTNDEDPESALANRVIALAVERSLNEIQNGKQADIGRTGKNVLIPTTQRTTTTTTTTTPAPITTTTSLPMSTVNDNTPSLEEDIKQFQEDTKLLQALLKATGQDPSKFNIPTLPPNMNVQVSSNANKDSTLLPKLSSPSPFNKQHDSSTLKSTIMTRPIRPMTTASTTARPFGARIVVKDDLKNVQDEAKLLQTLVKLQGARETTTQRPKLAITGQSPDEALQKLIQQAKPASMMSDATKTPVSISTEYGKSNDALLAALLKEQGFGPTTASSLDEQLRLAALLNQVVVTPKARRTTTTPPPPPQVQRRPILDGLAWLWQQWRETGPGPGGARPSRKPTPSAGPSITAASSPQGSRLNWFGSGPFVGNADDGRETNRVPLEPPRAVAGGQAPARGQLVSAAINVTRAFSQFLGAALQGAAKTVQSVIQAGQRATNDIYANGSG